MKSSKLISIITKLNNLESCLDKANNLQKTFKTFLDSDLTLLCYLVDNKADRYKTAKCILNYTTNQDQLIKQEVSKNKAKEWLSKQDQELTLKIRAEKFIIE